MFTPQSANFNSYAHAHTFRKEELTVQRWYRGEYGGLLVLSDRGGAAGVSRVSSGGRGLRDGRERWVSRRCWIRGRSLPCLYVVVDFVWYVYGIGG